MLVVVWLAQVRVDIIITLAAGYIGYIIILGIIAVVALYGVVDL